MVPSPAFLLLKQRATLLSSLPLCLHCVCLLLLSLSTFLVQPGLACEKECSLKASQEATPPSSSSSLTGTHSHSRVPVASIAIGAFSCFVVACILILAAFSFFIRRWRNRHSQNQLPAYNIYTAVEENIPPIRRFTAKELQISTSNFCYQLGRKPNSTIFKGWVDGTPVAVKRVDSKGGGQDGFLASVYQASCVNHTNLVKLLGFCLEGSEMMLVYEYLEAGSLDMVLMKAAEALDWDTRYSIAMKVVQTLLFLHEECGECLAHGNVKLENIMLGDDWCPKLADFGLADLCVRDKIAALKHAQDKSNANLSPNLSNGNVSPTWLSGFKASAATDVYGFGLVLLSLILGRGNIVDALAASNDPIFLEWIYLQAKQGMYEDALDTRLLLEANPKEVRVALQLAFCCMQDSMTARPTTQRVWQVLRDREELGLPLLSSLAFGCNNSSSESDRNFEDPGDHVLVLDVEKDKENGATGNEEIEPCYQVFSMRSHKRSVSSVSSV